MGKKTEETWKNVRAFAIGFFITAIVVIIAQALGIHR